MTIENNWSIEVKIYRSTIANSGDVKGDNNILYSVSFPELEETCIIKNNMIMSTSTNTTEKLLDSSSQNWYNTTFDTILQDKLSNIWNLRQVVKGDAGESFVTRDKTRVRCCNLFTSTGFKGLVIQLERSNLEIDGIVDILHSMGIRDYTYNKDTLAPASVDKSERSKAKASLSTVASQFIKVLM